MFTIFLKLLPHDFILIKTTSYTIFSHILFDFYYEQYKCRKQYYIKMRHHERCSQIYIYTILSTIKQRFMEKPFTDSNHTEQFSQCTSTFYISSHNLSLKYRVFWHDDDVTPSICIVWSEWFILFFEFVQMTKIKCIINVMQRYPTFYSCRALSR